jgi:hypothetical protein
MPLLINSQTYIVNTETSWGGGSPGIYRTTNGGTTWTQVATQGPGGSPPVVASDGTIYWAYNGGLLKSTNAGVSWTVVGSGLQNIHPIILPDGRLVAVGANNIVVSSNGGSSWITIGATLPYNPWGSNSFIYSLSRKTFFISRFDCGNVVLSNAIMSLDYDFGFGTPTNQTPVGSFDEIRLSDGVIRGWSYDPDAPTTSNTVNIYIDGTSSTGTLISGAATNVLRSDINSTFSITGNHGVEFTIPAQYRNGASHSIYMYGVDTSSGSITTLLTGSPRSFTLFSGATPVIGDINLDHIVNSIDFSILNSHWFQNYAPADLNNDGLVNAIDFSMLNANWFRTW